MRKRILNILTGKTLKKNNKTLILEKYRYSSNTVFGKYLVNIMIYYRNFVGRA